MSKSDLIVYIIGFIMTFILWFIPADESKGLTSTSMHLFAIFIL